MTRVITVITRGELAILIQMDFNRGGLWWSAPVSESPVIRP